MNTAITLDAIRQARKKIEGRLVKTPVLDITIDKIRTTLSNDMTVSMKMELFQQAGSFKSRGAYIGASDLTPEKRKAGVVTVSGGNHALAVSWAAAAEGISAKVCMPRSVDPVRVEGCKANGADVVLCDTIADAFSEMERCAAEEGRTILHPFEAEHMTLGAATCAMEYVEARPDIDVFIVPIGGGGLISGMSAAIKLMKPEATVIGVEPFGADAMSQSFKTGDVVTIDKVDTIADSLGAPMTLPYSLALARQYVDDIVRIEDDEMRTAMVQLYGGLKIVAEPACASTLAALNGPAREHCAGKRVGIIACGSNISLERFQSLTGR